METNEMRLEAQDLNQQAAPLLKVGNPEAAKTKLDYKITELLTGYVDDF